MNMDEVKRAIVKRKQNIRIIPDTCVLDKRHVQEFSNSEFIVAFKEMQELIIAIYDKIVEDPGVWGYPVPDTDSDSLLLERLPDILRVLVLNGTFDKNDLVVNLHEFSEAIKKRHQNLDLMINMLVKNGFCSSNYENAKLNKQNTFTISIPNNPNILKVIAIYTEALETSIPNIPSWNWHKYTLYGNFSYRWIEDPSVENHEKIFLVKTDMLCDELHAIHFNLYNVAKEYGFSINIEKPFDKDCMIYMKGNNAFLYMGEREENGQTVVYSKILLRKIFKKNMEKIYTLPEKFNETFKENCRYCNNDRSPGSCKMRITYKYNNEQQNNCPYNSFYFKNVTLEDMPFLLDLFVTETGLKKQVI